MLFVVEFSFNKNSDIFVSVSMFVTVVDAIVPAVVVVVVPVVFVVFIVVVFAIVDPNIKIPQWKTTFSGRRPSVEYDLRWNGTFSGSLLCGIFLIPENENAIGKTTKIMDFDTIEINLLSISNHSLNL